MKICAICNKEIKGWSYPCDLKDAVICDDCARKVNLAPVTGRKKVNLLVKESITLQEVKQYIDEDKKFDLKALKSKGEVLLNQQNEQKQQEIAAFKKKSVKYSHYYFNRTERKIYIGKTFLDPDRFVDADEITSYRVNEKGHDENKHHVFTRAAVGAIIAGPAGAVIAGTTGGKINEYIDHLGLIINLTDGSNFEVSLLNSKNNKADGFLVRHAYSDLNDVIAILDSWKATEKVVEDIQDSNDAPAEIRKYKHLLDDGIITQKEFDAKKKQLLGL